AGTGPSAPGSTGRSEQRNIPTIVNNDRHLMVFTTSLYEVFDAESLLIEMSSWRPRPELDIKRDRDGRLETFEALYQRRPRQRTAPGGSVLVARLEWQGGPLVVETNSTERDLEIREKLALLPPSDVRFFRTEGRSVADAMAEPIREEERRRAEKEERDLAADPEVRARLTEMMRDYSRQWCDTVIPALAKRRPRTLVRTATGRAKVLALIEEMESKPHPEGTGGMDFALIRRELSLPSAR
ncbi:MAG: hypothetical protein ACRD1P_10115, partial [Thermoanaerobaculia bacterium]